MSPSPVQEWLPKAEAAEALGVSVREIERKAHSGRIRTNKVRLEGERSDRTVYSAEDVMRVKQERESGVMQLAPRSAAPGLDQHPFLAALTAQMLKAPATQIDKPWMTLDEAAEYSGLPASTISGLLKKAEIYALGRGPKTWRVQRSSLDKFSCLDFEP